jgi:hypothetical protein
MTYSIFDMLDPPHKPKPKPKLKAKAKTPVNYPLNSDDWEIVYWHGDSGTAVTGNFYDLLSQFWQVENVPQQIYRCAEQYGSITLGDDELGVTITSIWLEIPEFEADESNNKMPESLSHPETQ